MIQREDIRLKFDVKTQEYKLFIPSHPGVESQPLPLAVVNNPLSLDEAKITFFGEAMAMGKKKKTASAE